jgi:ribosomal protein L4
MGERRVGVQDIDMVREGAVVAPPQAPPHHRQARHESRTLTIRSALFTALSQGTCFAVKDSDRESDDSPQ